MRSPPHQVIRKRFAMLTLLGNYSGHRLLLAGISLLFCIHGLAQAADKQSIPAAPFAVARVHFESNATDGDVEVVFDVKGTKDGLAKLSVVSPDGRTVIDFTAPDASTLGIRQFSFESPEPKNIESLKSAYPAGVYTFAGVTVAGETLYSQSSLNHKLPAAASFLKPAERTLVSVTESVSIAWLTVEWVTGVIIEIKQSESGASITAELPGSATSFAVPAGFLVPDSEYELSIGNVNEDGNISFVETTITTAGHK